MGVMLQQNIIAVLAANSQPVNTGKRRTYDSWMDYKDMTDYTAHITQCGLDMPKCSWDDSEWSEFAGTFAEPQWPSYHGLDVIITCKCSKLRAKRFRSTMSRAELLTKLVEMPDPVDAG